jgi:hypothetical protein
MRSRFPIAPRSCYRILKARAHTPLLAFLHTNQSVGRDVVVDRLAMFGSRVAGPMVKLMLDTKEDPTIRGDAMNVLRMAKQRGALDAIVSCLDDRTLRFDALRAMSELTGQKLNRETEDEIARAKSWWERNKRKYPLARY